MMPSAYFEEFFLEASAKTYAGGLKEKTTIQELPGSKVLKYQRGDLLYVDTYFTNGEYSGGNTLICRDEKPVWLMSYQGWCQGDNKTVLDFLKQALSAAYATSQFIGGRGPKEFWEKKGAEEGLVYKNDPDLSSDFCYFGGREHIFCWPDRYRRLFWHRYQGQLLLPYLR